MKRHPLLLGGRPVETGETLNIRFPFDDEIVAEVCLADEAVLNQAIELSVDGFAKTRRLPVYKRVEVLRKLQQLMVEREEELARALLMEGGKVVTLAHGEVGRAVQTIRVSAEEAARIHGEILTIDDTADGDSRIGQIRRFPLGPVLAIAPFNYPLNLACHKIGPAIAAGNSILLKPASATPLSALLLGEMIVAAGYPAEAVSVLPCPGARAEMLARDERVAFLSFTGSAEVGWRLKSVAGRKGVGLELGGNAAVIVHEDADLDYAAARIKAGGFANAGQNCISVQRVLVHKSVYEKMVELLTAAVRSIPHGDPRERETVVGPMIDGRSAEKALAMIQDARDKGARVLVGGELEGSVLQPTLLADATPDMRVRNEEIFAPVIALSSYESFEEAVDTANATAYGLQHGVFTRDIERIEYAYEELQCGGVIVNDISTFRVDHMPYGGVKNSGIGKEGPRCAIEEMTVPKLLILNRAGARGSVVVSGALCSQ